MMRLAVFAMVLTCKRGTMPGNGSDELHRRGKDIL